MWDEIQERTKKLDQAIEHLAENGRDLAEKEKEYKIALNQKALQLRAEDMPVTLINQVIYGYKDIALLRLARDTAQVKYNANQEFINVLKLEIRIIENQIAREYGNTK
jgi:hypothetical protein